LTIIYFSYWQVYVLTIFIADLVKNADLMWKQSVWTSVIASNIGAHYLKEGGMLVLTGAQAALKATAGK